MTKKYIILGLILFSLAYPKASIALSEKEERFGFYTDKIIISNHTIVFNEILNKRINEIGNKVAKAFDIQDIKYTFRVINDPIINAYSAAGGFIYINTGLLDFIESENELAAVMAHEIAHAGKGHQINSVYAAHRRAVAGRAVGLAIGVGIGMLAGSMSHGSTPTYGYPSYNNEALVRQMIQLGFQVGENVGNALAVAMIKGYGKEKEIEADTLAIQHTKKAGYDPYALISFFKRLISTRDRLGLGTNKDDSSFINVLKTFISPRDRLDLDKYNYNSNLINAEPGLEERIKNIEELITKAK